MITLNQHREIHLAVRCFVADSEMITTRQSLHGCYGNVKQNLNIFIMCRAVYIRIHVSSYRRTKQHVFPTALTGCLRSAL